MKSLKEPNVMFIFNGPTKNGMSGGDNHSIRLANLLSRKGYKTSAVLHKGTYEKYFNQEVDLIISNHIIPQIAASTFILLFFYYLPRILFTIIEIHKNKYDLLVSSSHLFYDTVPLFFYPNTKSITYIHHIISEQKRSFTHGFITSNLEKVSFYILKKNKSLIFVDSLKVKNALVNKYHFDSNLISITQNGIDLNFINSIKVDRKKYDFVFCGRLNKTKGIYDLIQVVKEVKKEANISLLVIGDGPEREGLLAEIKKNKLEKNITLAGFLNEREKIKKIKESRFFLLPSHEEGWGIVIGEALASGINVIAYKLDDIKDIWKNNCIWVSPFNITEFARKSLDAIKSNNRSAIDKKFVASIDWDIILWREEKIIRTKGIN